MLRAGFTEVLVTGMLTRWIRVSTNPMGMPAKPAGAEEWVARSTVRQSTAVSSASIRKAAPPPKPPGECAP